MTSHRSDGRKVVLGQGWGAPAGLDGNPDQPRAVRHRRGASSPVGFYLDSHDFDALRCELLDPMRAGAGARYRTAVFDEPTDSVIEQTPRTLAGDEVLLSRNAVLRRPLISHGPTDQRWTLRPTLDVTASV